MLNNLKAEYVRQGIEPYRGVMEDLKCSDKTARNKLNGCTAVTVSEAFIIIEKRFKGLGLSIEYLFQDDNRPAHRA